MQNIDHFNPLGPGNWTISILVQNELQLLGTWLDTPTGILSCSRTASDPLTGDQHVYEFPV